MTLVLEVSNDLDDGVERGRPASCSTCGRTTRRWFLLAEDEQVPWCAHCSGLYDVGLAVPPVRLAQQNAAAAAAAGAVGGGGAA